VTFYQKTTLENGLRIITERIPHVRSVSVGVWVAAGSRLETPEQAGISHLIEHMLFKGTERRTAREISAVIDGRGGTLNAFTSKEHTCYYAKCLDEHQGLAIDLLGDMLRNSKIAPEELVKEQGVVCEEIKMYEDVPDDLVHDLFVAELWPDHPLGRPIAGTVDSVRRLTREDLLSYMQEHYRPDHIVIAASGNLEHDQVVEQVSEAIRFDGTAPRPIDWGIAPKPPQSSRLVIRRKEIEQVHLVLGVAGLPVGHDQTLALQLLNTVLGGGTSSRLFQEVREERGLAYTVYSYHSAFRDSGNCGVYAACSPGQLDQVLGLIQEILLQVGEEGVTEAELEEAKAQLKGQLMLGLESTSSRMTRLGRNELTLGEIPSPDDVIARIDRVTVDEVRKLAGQIYRQPGVLSVVGPVPSNFTYKPVTEEVLLRG
jgi:predicted Zn-dependent peptidase